jgi:catechol 2,3-dioxygenase-like lactoylglutathione lyase family enzyme
MTVCPYFHIGILVPDLEAAVAKFSDAFGLTFTDVATAEYELALPLEGRLLKRRSRVRYSMEGPPHYELMQADSSDFFGPPEMNRVHHVGLWAPDIASAQLDLHGKGLRTQAQVRRPDGQPGVFFTDPADAFGIRFEVLNDTRRPGFDRFVATGDPQYLT